MLIGATASGTTINGGLGTDTFTAGSGYDGGNHFVGSARSNTEGFNAVGSCANYSSLADRVTVNLNTGNGQGFDTSGNLLWTDTYTNIQQVKAGQLDCNVLTGSDAFYCELKAGLGSTTYHGGAAGDRIIWGSAGATGLLDGRAADIAYGGTGADEFYWRNSPGGKGVSNFGETIYGFDPTHGDDLNLSEFADAGFAGVTQAFNGTDNNVFNWADISLSADGKDTYLWFDKVGTGNFTQVAAVLKNDNLFVAYGVSDTSSIGAHQVLQDLYSGGGLVLVQPH
jgi:Ca2+-binding RTX toxin-like protein